jgi:hypothetical protein
MDSILGQQAYALAKEAIALLERWNDAELDARTGRNITLDTRKFLEGDDAERT